jgi:imidazolonepropionase-like amidohydrolase
VLRLADEFNLRVVIVGGLEAAKVADELRRRDIPVLLSLEMPEPLRSYDPLSPPTLTSLRNRALAYQNAAILHEKGVRFAFTTEGLGDPERLLRNIRTAIANGLPKEAALRALTLTPAEILGIQNRFGDLAVGKTASFVVVRGELFEPRARIEFAFADGKRFKVSEATPTASAPAHAAVPPPARLGRREHRQPAGSLLLLPPRARQHPDPHAQPRPRGARLRRGMYRPPHGRRPAAPRERRANKRRNLHSLPTERTEQAGAPDETPTMPRVKLTPLMPPPADEHNTWLIRNATVWTLAHDKPLPNTDVLVVDGTIAAVGKNLTAPPNARIIDGTGKHLTPGLMDCHSHTAISGGVNEGTNVCTAEVRIQDVINPDDVNIYRQLAGGVTSALMLHGSANVIGGQSIVVKWRWGKTADEMIFKEAPAGIKFALGENVKRSNFRTPGSHALPRLAHGRGAGDSRAVPRRAGLQTPLGRVSAGQASAATETRPAVRRAGRDSGG